MRKFFLIAVLAVCCCALAPAYAEDRLPAITRENYTVIGGSAAEVREETDRLVLSGEGVGMGYTIPMDASAQVDVTFSAEIAIGDYWACVGFMRAPQSAHVGQAQERGISVLFRNAGGRLRADVYVCLGNGQYDPEKTAFTTTARVGADEQNVLSLRRSGSEYFLLVNGTEILTDGGENPVQAFFEQDDFLTDQGMTYVCFGQNLGSTLSVFDIYSRPPAKDASNWTNQTGTGFENGASGLILTESAICTYDLNALYVELQFAQISPGAGTIAFGLGASSVFGDAPGVTLALSESEGEAFLEAAKAGGEPARIPLGVPLSELSKLGLRSFGESYRVEVNGETAGFAAFETGDFSRNGICYLSVTLSGESSLTLSAVESSNGDFGKGAALDPRNWQNWMETVEERDSSILIKADASLQTTWYADYVQYSLSLIDLSAGKVRVALFASAAAPTAAGGARGMMLEFSEIGGRIFVNGYKTALRSAEPVFSSFDAGPSGQPIEVLFKAKTKQGMVLTVNGVRVTEGGEDVFDERVAELASAAGYFFFGVGLEGSAQAEVFSVSSQNFDPEPEVTVPDEVVPEGALGMDAEAWTEDEPGSIVVNEGGTLDMYKPAILTTPLDPDYVAVRLELQTLTDSTAQDGWLTIALCADPSDTYNASPFETVRVPAASLILMFKNAGGMLQMGVFYRYEGQLYMIRGLETFLAGVAGTYTFEFVYFDSEMTLYVNGQAFTAADGSNPLADIGRVNYVGEDGKTYLGFYSYSPDTNYSGRNARRWTLLGLENQMPEYFSEQLLLQDYIPVEEFPEEEPDRSWLTVCLIAGGISLGAGLIAGGTIAVLLGKKRGKRA